MGNRTLNRKGTEGDNGNPGVLMYLRRRDVIERCQEKKKKKGVMCSKGAPGS